MENKAKKSKYIPNFEEWYVVNSRGYIRRGETPYTEEEARKVYNKLVKQKFGFPHWN
jgi:hypothetical protein|tara:strand:- start:22 stop:192 length:171 start_codon:yes stop_codon:yes gene_type:complete